jgi:hypothetical protein
MADALDHDYARSSAVLIGAWDYVRLKPVPAARRSLDRMRETLTGPLCNWPEERVLSLPNPARLGELPHLLVKEFLSATDVALFYFVGHGQYDEEERLCMALGETDEEEPLRATSSLTFDAVRHAFNKSPASTKIAILDCCFAGLAAKEGRLGAVSPHIPAAPGSYLMMASGPYSQAWFQDDPELEHPQTYFTKYFLDVVEGGLPGQPEGVQLRTVFDEAAARLVRDEKPAPGVWASDHSGRFVFARNAAPPGLWSKHTEPGPRGRDLEAEATISFHDSIRGTVAAVRLPAVCGSCRGEGELGGEPCATCGGSGEAAVPGTARLPLRPGVADGERVRFPGRGWASPVGGTSGDLTVTVHVEPDPVFSRSEDDLLARLPVAYSELTRGATVSLLTPKGWTAVRVPIGSAYGDLLRVAGRGVPREDGAAGDLLVTLDRADPSDEAADARLLPVRPRVRALPPKSSGKATVFKWSFLKLCGFTAGLIGMIVLGFTVIIGGMMLLDGLHEFLARLWGTTAMIGMLGAVLALSPRLFAWRRPPLVITDKGVTARPFGFLSWKDIAGVRPSAPGHPWVTVVPRRTRLLSTGQRNPLAVPPIMVTELRGRPEDIAERMQEHCPSLVVDPRA